MIDQKGFASDLSGLKQKQKIHRFLVKLSENCGILPPTLSVSGIINCSREPVNGGGFADIFRASFHGEEVALKRLRDFQVHHERERVRRVRFSPYLLVANLTFIAIEILQRSHVVAEPEPSVRAAILWH